MKPTVTIEIPADCEALVRRCLALQEEMRALALSAPAGTVLDACETAILEKGRDLQLSILDQAVAQRVQDAEKKGRRSEAATVAGSRKTGAKLRVNTSRPLA